MQHYPSLNAKYCSKLCSQKGQVTKFKHKCRSCDKEFIAHISSERKYCSYGCFLDLTRKNKKPKIRKEPIRKEPRYCKNCKQELKRRRSFCSIKCMSEGYKTSLRGSNNPNFGNGHKTKLAHERGCYDNVDRKNSYSYGTKIFYKNEHFKSSWEYHFAKFLDDKEIKWLYEKTKFKLSNNKTYTPDFYLPKKDRYYEVKGYWRDKAKEKFTLFKKEYSNIKITVIDKKFYERLKINNNQRKIKKHKS